MAHSNGVARDSQRQIIILRAIAAASKPSDPLHDIPGGRKQMAEIHAAQQEVGGPIRLESGTNPVPGFVEVVFVRVDNLDVRILECLSHVVKSVGMQEVVVVEKG